MFGNFHDYRRDWISANGGRHPLQRERLPLSIFSGRQFLVEVPTVRHDSGVVLLLLHFIPQKLLVSFAHWPRMKTSGEGYRTNN